MNSSCTLNYVYNVNDTEISPKTDSESRYNVRLNELMIGNLTAADDNLSVKCIVQEENGYPGNVSNTILLPVEVGVQSKTGASKQHVSGYKSTDRNYTGWIVGIVILSVAVILGTVLTWCVCRKQTRPFETADGNNMKCDEFGSCLMDRHEDSVGQISQ